jgi:hypothetical protein
MLAIGIVPGSRNSTNTHQMYQEANAQWQPVVNNSAVPYPMLQHTSGQQAYKLFHCTNATPHDTTNT